MITSSGSRGRPTGAQLHQIHRLVLEVESDHPGEESVAHAHGLGRLGFGGDDAVELVDGRELLGGDRRGVDDDVGEPVALDGIVQRPLGHRGDREHADRTDRQRQREHAGDDATGCPAELAEHRTHHRPPRTVTDATPPSIIDTVRSAASASARSCVMNTTVLPVCASPVRISNTA